MEYGRSAARYDAIPASAPLEPVTGYGACKAAASVAAIALAAEHQVEMAIVRPFTVYGEGQHASNFLPSLLAAADSGQDFPMSPGEQVRDFQSVSDCAAAFLKVLQRPIQAGVAEITNTGSGVPRTLLAFAQEQWELRNARGKLLVGALPYRKNEVMRFVPLL
jgi:nucleoside-diphosphate-sugar epimerase